MPPGLGDTSLDVIQLIPRLEYLLVGNASKVVVASVRRALTLLDELDVSLIGVVENMRRTDQNAVADLAADRAVPFLGSIGYDGDLESALGDVDRLRQTAFYRGVAGLLA